MRPFFVAIALAMACLLLPSFGWADENDTYVPGIEAPNPATTERNTSGDSDSVSLKAGKLSDGTEVEIAQSTPSPGTQVVVVKDVTINVDKIVVNTPSHRSQPYGSRYYTPRRSRVRWRYHGRRLTASALIAKLKGAGIFVTRAEFKKLDGRVVTLESKVGTIETQVGDLITRVQHLEAELAKVIASQTAQAPSQAPVPAPGAPSAPLLPVPAGPPVSQPLAPQVPAPTPTVQPLPQPVPPAPLPIPAPTPWSDTGISGVRTRSVSWNGGDTLTLDDLPQLRLAQAESQPAPTGREVIVRVVTDKGVSVSDAKVVLCIGQAESHVGRTGATGGAIFSFPPGVDPSAFTFMVEPPIGFVLPAKKPNRFTMKDAGSNGEITAVVHGVGTGGAGFWTAQNVARAMLATLAVVVVLALLVVLGVPKNRQAIRNLSPQNQRAAGIACGVILFLLVVLTVVAWGNLLPR